MAITLNVVPETSYAPCGDLSLAYQVFGDGPVDLVYAGSFVSHVELAWTLPEYEAFMEYQRGRPGRHRLRGNTTGANAGVDSQRHRRLLLCRRLG